jgi:hypothetical protein
MSTHPQKDKVWPGPRRNASWLPVIVESRARHDAALARYEAAVSSRLKLQLAIGFFAAAVLGGLAAILLMGI